MFGDDEARKERAKMAEELGGPLQQAMAEAAKHAELFRAPAPEYISGSTFTPRDLSDLNPAKWMYDRLVKRIGKFEAKLDDQHEIGARLVSFGSMTVHVTDLGFWGPDMISFYGFLDKDEPFELHQHHTQVNVMLTRVRALDAKAKRIGFHERYESAK